MSTAAPMAVDSGAPAAAAAPAPAPAAAAAAAAAATPAATGDVVLHGGGIVKKILRPGTGDDTPPKNADVEVHYVGTLLDGTKFDSSRDRNDTFRFKIGKGEVIKGWDDGVATMKRGELALLTCKPEYAYGAHGSPPKIPPNATLQFEVELISWTKRQKVTDDKHVMKEIISAGEGYNRPNDGAVCKLRWRARTADGVVFADHWAAEQTITVGADVNQTEGFEESVKNLYKGEHSKFFVDAQYGYGAAGRPELKVPPNSALEYEIALSDFEKGKESWELSLDEKIAFGIKKKNAGNDFFKSGQTARAAKHYKSALDLFRYEQQFSDEQRKRVHDVQVTCNSNLAAVRHKEGDLKGVEEACTDALKIDPNHVKSLFRRAQVLAHRNELERASADLTALLAVDPKHAEGLKLMSAVKARQSAIAKKERNLFAGLFNKVSLVSKAELDAAAKRAAEKDEEDRRKRALDEAGDDSDSGDDKPAKKPEIEPASTPAAGPAAAAPAPAPGAAAPTPDVTMKPADVPAPAAGAPAPAAAGGPANMVVG